MQFYEIVITPNSKQELLKLNGYLFNWRKKWEDKIGLSFLPSNRERRRRGSDLYFEKRVVVQAHEEAFDKFHEAITYAPIDLSPVWNIVAEVKDRTYEVKGVEVQGTKHFNPHDKVYPHTVHSGDGYERTYITGMQKDTGKYITLIGSVDRFENWRIETVTNPIVVYYLNSFMGWQVRFGDDRTAGESTVKFMNERYVK